MSQEFGRSVAILEIAHRNLGAVLPSCERGVDAVPVVDSKGLGVYVSKIHLELTRSDLKTARRRNRTPWQIAAATGDTQDMARWAEYCETTKGSWLLTGLAALRERYPIPEPELTDEEIAQQEQDGTIVAHVDGTIWRKARTHKHAPLIAQALTAYETGGIQATANILALTGLDIEITTSPRRATTYQTKEQTMTSTLDTPLVHTMTEVSEILRVSRGSTYELIHTGQLETFKVGSRRLVSRAALLSFIDSQAYE